MWDNYRKKMRKVFKISFWCVKIKRKPRGEA
jgi:hypothetical protein